MGRPGEVSLLFSFFLKKNELNLALYFTPEHEEFARDGSRSVYWTPGIEKNYDAIAGRLLTPPVLRELQVRKWRRKKRTTRRRKREKKNEEEEEEEEGRSEKRTQRMTRHPPVFIRYGRGKEEATSIERVG